MSLYGAWRLLLLLKFGADSLEMVSGPGGGEMVVPQPHLLNGEGVLERAAATWEVALVVEDLSDRELVSLRTWEPVGL